MMSEKRLLNKILCRYVVNCVSTNFLLLRIFWHAKKVFIFLCSFFRANAKHIILKVFIGDHKTCKILRWAAKYNGLTTMGQTLKEKVKFVQSRWQSKGGLKSELAAANVLLRWVSINFLCTLCGFRLSLCNCQKTTSLPLPTTTNFVWLSVPHTVWFYGLFCY